MEASIAYEQGLRAGVIFSVCYKTETQAQDHTKLLVSKISESGSDTRSQSPPTKNRKLDFWNPPRRKNSE